MSSQMIELLWESLLETIIMTAAAGAISLALGLPLGLLLVATDKGGFWEKIASTELSAGRSTLCARCPSSSCLSQ